MIEQLQGFETAAGAWEREVLPARLHGYDPSWLDQLCLAGQVVWCRLSPRKSRRPRLAPLADAPRSRPELRRRAIAITCRAPCRPLEQFPPMLRERNRRPATSAGAARADGRASRERQLRSEPA